MDCDKYNIDVEVLFLTLVPPFWVITPETGVKKDIWEAYLKVIGGSFEDFQSLMLAECQKLKAFLMPTGQHLSLEEHLNDLYDHILRRIFITENDIPATENVWMLYGEYNPQSEVWYLQSEVDPAPKAWYLESETGNKNHFTINIPVLISFVEEVLRGYVDPYVVNGYNYNIITF